MHKVSRSPHVTRFTARSSSPRPTPRTATAQTERGDSSFGSAIGHGVDELDQHGCAAGADGMAQCDCSTVHVDAGLIEAEFADHGESLHAEGLVQLE